MKKISMKILKIVVLLVIAVSIIAIFSNVKAAEVSSTGHVGKSSALAVINNSISNKAIADIITTILKVIWGILEKCVVPVIRTVAENV